MEKNKTIFKEKITSHFLSLIKNSKNPEQLEKQVSFDEREYVFSSHESSDPLEEEKYRNDSFIIKKYHRRALVLLSNICPAHCRYCFRKFFNYSEDPSIEKILNELSTFLSHHSELNEIIFSGGDPLSVSNQGLGEIIQYINKYPQIEVLRMHTRFPIFSPKRIDEGLIKALELSNKKWIFVIHTNHPDEINELTIAGLQLLKKADVTLLNQSVLLAGVNDNPETLYRLNKCLFENGVQPYYLHHMDPIQGGSHFIVDIARGKSIMAELGSISPGYLMPRYVMEIPGEMSKTLIC